MFYQLVLKESHWKTEVLILALRLGFVMMTGAVHDLSTKAIVIDVFRSTRMNIVGEDQSDSYSDLSDAYTQLRQQG